MIALPSLLGRCWNPSQCAGGEGWVWCSDHANLTKETLEKQYELVKQRTSQDFTYQAGSHVIQYGEVDLDVEASANFLGYLNTGAP